MAGRPKATHIYYGSTLADDVTVPVSYPAPPYTLHFFNGYVIVYKGKTRVDSMTTARASELFLYPLITDMGAVETVE